MGKEKTGIYSENITEARRILQELMVENLPDGENVDDVHSKKVLPS
jgi:hypothetical protein